MPACWITADALAHEPPDLGAGGAIGLEVGGDHDRVRAQRARPRRRHRRVDAEAARLVAGGRHDRARAGARDDQRQPAQLRAPAQLDRRVEGVDVEVGDDAASGHRRNSPPTSDVQTASLEEGRARRRRVCWASGSAAPRRSSSPTSTWRMSSSSRASASSSSKARSSSPSSSAAKASAKLAGALEADPRREAVGLEAAEHRLEHRLGLLALAAGDQHPRQRRRRRRRGRARARARRAATARRRRRRGGRRRWGRARRRTPRRPGAAARRRTPRRARDRGTP